jgi:hypothetical protein
MELLLQTKKYKRDIPTENVIIDYSYFYKAKEYKLVVYTEEHYYWHHKISATTYWVKQSHGRTEFTYSSIEHIIFTYK